MNEARTNGGRAIFAGLAVLWGALLVFAMAVPNLSGAQKPSTMEKMVFQARLLPKEGGQSTMVKFEVDGLTTKEEVGHLQSAFNLKDAAAFRTEFRKTPKATMKFYEWGSTIHFNAAFVEPAEKGTRITLFAEDRTLGTISNDVPLGRWYLVAVLNIDEKGRGDGRLYQSALVNFTDDNRMELDTYRRSPMMIIQVRKTT